MPRRCRRPGLRHRVLRRPHRRGVAAGLREGDRERQGWSGDLDHGDLAGRCRPGQGVHRAGAEVDQRCGHAAGGSLARVREVERDVDVGPADAQAPASGNPPVEGQPVAVHVEPGPPELVTQPVDVTAVRASAREPGSHLGDLVVPPVQGRDGRDVVTAAPLQMRSSARTTARTDQHGCTRRRERGATRGGGHALDNPARPERSRSLSTA